MRAARLGPNYMLSLILDWAPVLYSLVDARIAHERGARWNQTRLPAIRDHDLRTRNRAPRCPKCPRVPSRRATPLPSRKFRPICPVNPGCRRRPRSQLLQVRRFSLGYQANGVAERSEVGAPGIDFTPGFSTFLTWPSFAYRPDTRVGKSSHPQNPQTKNATATGIPNQFVDSLLSIKQI